MEDQNHITRKQHYIPQFHFRNFSSMEKGIYRFDLLNPDKESIIVPIDSECYKNDLYEIYKENQTIISQNYLEKTFAKYEKGIASTINHIKQKAFDPSNLGSSLFLTTDEKTALSIFLTLEILRRPEIIKKGSELYMQMTDGSVKDYEANNYALLHMFPLPDVNMEDDIVFFRVFEWFNDKTFRVGITDSNCIFLGDIPFYFESEEKVKKPIIAVFPLSSNIVLFLYPKKNIKVEHRNRLFKMDNEIIQAVQSSIARMSKRWIYSYNPIGMKEKVIIKEAIGVK